MNNGFDGRRVMSRISQWIMMGSVLMVSTMGLAHSNFRLDPQFQVAAMGPVGDFAVTRDNHLLVLNQHRSVNAEQASAQLQLLTATGQLKQHWLLPQLRDPQALALGDHGRIYVAGQQQLFQFTPNSQSTTPHPASDKPTLTKVSGRVFEDISALSYHEGQLYVGQVNRLTQIDKQGQVMADWPLAKQPLPVRPQGIAVGYEHLYIADPANHQLAVYDHQGGYIKGFASQIIQCPQDVAITAYDELYVLDRRQGSPSYRVLLFNLTGTLIDEFSLPTVVEDGQNKQVKNHQSARLYPSLEGGVFVADGQTLYKYRSHPSLSKPPQM